MSPTNYGLWIEVLRGLLWSIQFFKFVAVRVFTCLKRWRLVIDVVMSVQDPIFLHWFWVMGTKWEVYSLFKFLWSEAYFLAMMIYFYSFICFENVKWWPSFKTISCTELLLWVVLIRSSTSGAKCEQYWNEAYQKLAKDDYAQESD